MRSFAPLPQGFFTGIPADCINVIGQASDIDDAAMLAMTCKRHHVILNRATTKRYLQSMAVISIVKFDENIYFITQNGHVFARGKNYKLSLGLGDADFREYFEEIPDLVGVRQIVRSGRHAPLFITGAGEVFACGNMSLYLDVRYPEPFIQPSSKPVKVAFNKKIVKTMSDALSNCFLTDEGEVYVLGREGWGEFGLGLVREIGLITEPTLIPNMPRIRDIYYTGAQLFMLTLDNLLYVCGDNQYGELGLGNRVKALQPVRVPLLSNIKSIETSDDRVYALTFQGRVYAWGYNEHGRLGFNNANQYNSPELLTGLANIVSMSLGENNFFITADGHVYGFGVNEHGELGLGDQNPRTTPVLIPDLYRIKQILCNKRVVFFQTEDNHIYATGEVWRSNEASFCVVPELISDCPAHDLIVQRVFDPAASKVHWLTRDGVMYVSDRKYADRQPREHICIPSVGKILKTASLADLLYYSEGRGGYTQYCYQLALKKIQAAITVPQILEMLPLLDTSAWNNCPDIKAILPAYNLVLAYANDRANQESARLVVVAWAQLVAIYRRASSSPDDLRQLRDFMGALNNEVLLKSRLALFLPPQSARRSNQALLAQLQADPVALRVAARLLLAELPELELKRKAEGESGGHHEFKRLKK